jgi:serine/threonine-protein kinase
MSVPDTQFVALQEALAGRYSLERELGRGGMGIVYLAHEVALDRPVALKLLPAHLAVTPTLRDRFLREARTAAKLSHPHIVPIHAVDQVRDFVFFAMSFVDGETLGQRIRSRGPLPASDAARILREVAWALAYAHAQGVIHRDVKPDNILLETATGRALVTDFGIAAVAARASAADEEPLTGVHEVIGTAEFMSPEQASGDAVDARSDLYSLGCVAYYALSGRLPFEGPSVAAILARHLAQPPTPLATAAPEVSSRLARAVDRCLAKNPDERFPSGEALADALAQGIVTRRDLPIPLRVFIKRAREAYHSTGAVTLLGVIFVPWILGMAFSGFWDGALFFTGLAGAILSAPFASILYQARKLAKAGYGLEDLRLAIREDVSRREEEIRFEYGTRPSMLARIARPLVWAGLAGILISSGAAAVVPGVAQWGTVWTAFGVSLATFGVSGVIVARHDERRRDIWGKRFLRFWQGRVGALLHRLVTRRVTGGAAVGGVTYRPTELAIGLAADRLFEGLPKQVRAELADVPHALRRLEADAQTVRARIEELNALLAEAGSERTPVAADRRAAVKEGLERQRATAEDRLRDAVTALETIRLNLLRMHAGAGTVESVTADLEAAREVSEAVARLAAGRAEVERLLAES